MQTTTGRKVWDAWTVSRSCPVCCLRSAKLFDRHPVLKALICKDTIGDHADLNHIATAYLAGQHFYVPTGLFPRSLAQSLRQFFEFPPSEDTGMDTSLTALRYLRALLDLAERHQLLDRGPPRMRRSRSKSKVHGELLEPPHCHVTQTKIKGFCVAWQVDNLQVLSAPEPGCLLIAHPLLRCFHREAQLILLVVYNIALCHGVLLMSQ